VPTRTPWEDICNPKRKGHVPCPIPFCPDPVVPAELLPREGD
jgi:hypothetical protein